MKTTITRTCGHTTSEQITGSSRERDSRISYLRNQPCRECKAATQQITAEANAEQQSLPQLIGSEKQVAWALRIRDAAATKIDSFLAEARRQAAAAGHDEAQIATGMAPYDAMATKLLAKTCAAWWIDQRDATAQALLRSVA